jgi:hypothetical protein
MVSLGSSGFFTGVAPDFDAGIRGGQFAGLAGRNADEATAAIAADIMVRRGRTSRGEISKK